MYVYININAKSQVYLELQMSDILLFTYLFEIIKCGNMETKISSTPFSEKTLPFRRFDYILMPHLPFLREIMNNEVLFQNNNLKSNM